MMSQATANTKLGGTETTIIGIDLIGSSQAHNLIVILYD